MKDLKSQLAERFGVQATPVEEAAPAAGGEPEILAEDAHLESTWLKRLRSFVDNTRGAPELAQSPKLGQARQVTDQLCKSLKKAGRKRDAADLLQLRSDFYTKRDKAAWGLIKQRFKKLGLSDKAYRGVKQGSSEPVPILNRLRKADDAELSGMGAKRLRDYLTGARRPTSARPGHNAGQD